MICEKCHAAEATVFLTQIVEGEMRKIDDDLEEEYKRTLY